MPSVSGASMTTPPTAGVNPQRHQTDSRPLMARIVVKFGGTSVADLTRIRTVADRVKREVDAGLLQDMMVFEFVQREVLRAAA